MATCEHCAMMFACQRCVCGVAYCDEICQHKDYARHHKGKCTFKVLRKTSNGKSIPDDVIKQTCRLCGLLYAWGHGAAGRAVAFYLETMLDDGLPPATLIRYSSRTICSSKLVQQKAGFCKWVNWMTEAITTTDWCNKGVGSCADCGCL